MAKVTGLGGVFYVVKDPEATRLWYREVLGIEGDYGPQLMWSEEPKEQPYSLVSHFKDDDYIKPGVGGFMINLRVDDCDAMVAQLEAKGVECSTARTRAMASSPGCSIPTASRSSCGSNARRRKGRARAGRCALGIG